MQWIGSRMRDGLQAAKTYDLACEATSQDALPLVNEVEKLVRQNRDQLVALGAEFERIWNLESKPYALDWTVKRYGEMTGRYDDLLKNLATARDAAEAGEPIPSARQIGLPLPEQFSRQRRPQTRQTLSLAPDDPWLVPQATHRIGLAIHAGEIRA